MKCLILDNVTLVAVTTSDEVDATIKAIKYSSKKIKFKERILFTNKKNLEINSIDTVYVPKFKNIGEWGRFIVFDLYKHINTDFIILIHSDGFIVNPESWNWDFLNFDYIGAPWKIPNDNYTFRDINGELIRVGNSVSIRSKKLLEAPTKLKLKWENFVMNFPYEDGYLCVQNRHKLLELGIKFADLNLACQFGREYHLPEHINIEPFTFHKWRGPNKIYPCFNPFQVKIKKFKNTINKLKRMIGFE